MAEERLHKLMAAAGLGSRRTCEQMILDGRVQVDGRVVAELGSRADLTKNRVLVDGRRLTLPEQHLYIKLHKPRGVISDVGGDMGGRKSVIDLLPEDVRRVFSVGRLDLHSEGLILLTDDGDLAHKLTHPRYQHPKTYFVLVAERPPVAALEQLRGGVDLPDGRTLPAKVRVVDGLPGDLQLSKGPNEGVWLEILLTEGKKRQIRHMMAAVGHPALRLVRWAIGPLTLGRLELGQYVALTAGELTGLRRMVGDPTPAPTEQKGKEKDISRRPPSRKGGLQAEKRGQAGAPSGRTRRVSSSHSAPSARPGKNSSESRRTPAGVYSTKKAAATNHGRPRDGRPSAPRKP
jgi:23S rRNA pseudouridine2605 synthase